ncbi:hypothetical protein BCR34DRAFT_156834 [Clohesyomyces aquaticus]|uniref:Uncharacterized protein n=1 Tax=Clohesyomyces aquaticus TaxID=1231657 RepID=A0A1Y1YKJ2_9PLEO|nr:hypothetical protein BCR34DRAFT_156834 [Clohesyomyces aquaticus]
MRFHLHIPVSIPYRPISDFKILGDFTFTTVENLRDAGQTAPRYLNSITMPHKGDKLHNPIYKNQNSVARYHITRGLGSSGYLTIYHPCALHLPQPMAATSAGGPTVFPTSMPILLQFYWLSRTLFSLLFARASMVAQKLHTPHPRFRGLADNRHVSRGACMTI